MTPITICNIICVLAKNGSFGFAKGGKMGRAKANVPFVRLVKKISCGGFFLFSQQRGCLRCFVLPLQVTYLYPDQLQGDRKELD